MHDGTCGVNIMGEQAQVRDVWACNLEEESCYIRELVERYPVVSIDIKSPGVVARPMGPFKQQTDVVYQTLRCNVDLLRIIQLGLTFRDMEGGSPQGPATWQFNFKFSLEEDMYSPSFIEFLVKAGVDFEKSQTDGIDVHNFGEFLMSSGIVLNDKVILISFNGGYDFGYILKILTFLPLPKSKKDFYHLLKTYFPCIYDVRYLAQNCKDSQRTLDKMIKTLDSSKSKPTSQSGSDSQLVSKTFFKLKSELFNNSIDEETYSGILYELLPRVNPAFVQVQSQ